MSETGGIDSDGDGDGDDGDEETTVLQGTHRDVGEREARSEKRAGQIRRRRQPLGDARPDGA